jgi:tetratricopeptide (TPR) repeat protein
VLRLPSLKALAAALFTAIAAASTGAPAGAAPDVLAASPAAAEDERARDIARLVALHCSREATGDREEPCITAALMKTPAADAALFRAASMLESMALFEQALSLYERIATNTPEMREAPAALERAMELRLLQGQVDDAKQRAASFEKAYGKAQPAALARAAVHIASHDARGGAWRDVRARLLSVIERIDRSATIDVRILAHALLGRAAAQLGDAKSAAAEYKKVTGAWRDPEAGMKSISAAFPDEAKMIARAVLVLNAVGEATFFFAEQRRAVVLRSPMPSYKGPDTREGILRHVNKVLTPWMKKKEQAIEEASDSYLVVLSIEPAAPPKWVVASAARVGWMWSDFIEELRDVPVPPEWRRGGPIPGGGGLTYEELRAAYEGVISRSTDVMMRRAKDAFLVCVQKSKSNSYFGEISRGCERWLAKSFPREHHVLDEIHDAPSRLAPPFLARPAERSLP